MRSLKENNKNFNDYAKLVNEIFNKFDFELNAITEECPIMYFYIKFIKQIFFKFENFLLNEENLL